MLFRFQSVLAPSESYLLLTADFTLNADAESNPLTGVCRKGEDREVLCALPKFWKVLHCERAPRLLTNGKLVFVVLSPPRLGAERHRAAFGV